MSAPLQWRIPIYRASTLDISISNPLKISTNKTFNISTNKTLKISISINKTLKISISINKTLKISISINKTLKISINKTLKISISINKTLKISISINKTLKISIIINKTLKITISQQKVLKLSISIKKCWKHQHQPEAPWLQDAEWLHSKSWQNYLRSRWASRAVGQNLLKSNLFCLSNVADGNLGVQDGLLWPLHCRNHWAHLQSISHCVFLKQNCWRPMKELFEQLIFLLICVWWANVGWKILVKKVFRRPWIIR